MQEGQAQFQVSSVVPRLSVSCFSSWAFTLHPPAFLPISFFHSFYQQAKFHQFQPTLPNFHLLSFQIIAIRSFLSLRAFWSYKPHLLPSAWPIIWLLPSALLTSPGTLPPTLCAFLAPHSNSSPFYYLTVFFPEDDKGHIPIHSVIHKRELSNHKGGHCYQQYILFYLGIKIFFQKN